MPIKFWVGVDDKLSLKILSRGELEVGSGHIPMSDFPPMSD